MALKIYTSEINPGDKLVWRGDIYWVKALAFYKKKSIYIVEDDRGINERIDMGSDARIYRDYDVDELDTIFSFKGHDEDDYIIYSSDKVKEIIYNELNEKQFEKLKKTPSVVEEVLGEDLYIDSYLKVYLDPEYIGRDIWIDIEVEDADIDVIDKIIEIEGILNFEDKVSIDISLSDEFYKLKGG